MNNKNRILLWIETILSETSKLEENKGIELLYKCGEACSKTSTFLKGAQKLRNQFNSNEDINKIFKAFKTEYYNTTTFTKEGNKIFLIFEKCTCPLVKEGVSNSFLCNCTLGYSKKIFETLFGRKIRVKLLKSILKGDSICKQEIIIENTYYEDNLSQ